MISWAQAVRLAGVLLALGGLGVLIPGTLRAIDLVQSVTDIPFEEISDGCYITDIVSREFTEGTGGPSGHSCVLLIVYEFCAPSSCGHRSIPGENSCDPDFVSLNGTTVACWRPKKGSEVNREIWPCGNPECYRVYEPGEQGGSKEHHEFLYPILYLLGIGIALCSGGCYVFTSCAPSEVKATSKSQAEPMPETVGI